MFSLVAFTKNQIIQSLTQLTYIDITRIIINQYALPHHRINLNFSDLRKPTCFLRGFLIFREYVGKTKNPSTNC